MKLNVGFIAGSFSYTLSNGRGLDGARTARFDPEEKSGVPEGTKHWSLTMLREKLVKTGAKVVRHGRYVTFQLAKVAVPRELFRKILSLIDDLRRIPAPA